MLQPLVAWGGGSQAPVIVGKGRGASCCCRRRSPTRRRRHERALERAPPLLSPEAGLEFPAPSNASAAAAAAAAAADGSPIKTSGLHRTPLSGGVQNATLRCDLPSPAVAGGSAIT